MRTNDETPSNLPVPFQNAPAGSPTKFQGPTPFLGNVADNAPTEGVVAYWRMVMRHKWIVVMIAFLGTSAGILVTLPQTPVYQSHTSLEVQGFNENFLNFQNLSPTSAPGGYVDPSYEILTQVKVLQSQSLISRVVQKLKDEKDAPPTVTQDRLAALRRLFRLTPKASVDRLSAINAAAGGISVKASGTTRIIDVTVDSTDPRLAAEFANTLVDQFIQKNLDDRWTTTERTGEWLQKQLVDLKVKLETSEDSLQSYASSVGLQYTNGGGDKDTEPQSVVDASVRLLQDELLKARTERMASQSRFSLVETSPPEALPQILDDPSVRENTAKLTELQKERAALSLKLTPEHKDMKALEAQIGELETSLAAAKKIVVERLHNEFIATQSHENLLNAEFEKQLGAMTAQAAMQVHYNLLKRDVETNRQLYESMSARVKESSISAAMRASNFRIIDPARPAGGPYKPNPLNNALLGSMAGLFLGVLVVLIREQADRSIQQPGDSALYLGISELGVIPSDRPAMLRGQKTGTRLSLANANRNSTTSPVELVTWERQSSLVAESFRALLTSILFSERRPKVLLIASANPGEGKTTVSSNLTIALAEISQRVLLIDADMRRPRLHRLFEMKNDKGLSDLLREKQPLNTAAILGAIRESRIPGLHVMTSGPWTANASTLLYSARLPEVLAVVRNSFDTVVIDTPPMLHIADARLLGKHADSVMLVVRAGKTTRTAAIMAIQKFIADGSALMGTILTDWNPDQNGYGYNYKYYKSHAKYYTENAPSEDPDIIDTPAGTGTTGS